MKIFTTGKKGVSARFFFSVCVISTLFLIGGCRGYHAAPEKSPFRLPGSFSDSGKSAVEARWWCEFNDPLMWKAVDKALHGNFTIKSALQRIKAASAEVERARSSLFPWVNAGTGLNHTIEKEGGSYLNKDRIYIDSTVSYEVDLWGRISSGVRAAEYDLAAQQADYEAARISLSSQVVIKYLEIAAIEQELRFIGKQIIRNRQSLQIIEDKYRFGQTDSLDLWQQKQLVEQTISRKIEAEKALDAAKKELALLMGLSATDSREIETSSDLPRLPPLPRTGIPAAVIRRRPDCIMALLRLKAANQRLAAAVSAQYPQLTLNGNVETDASAVKDLLENWIVTLSSSLLAPVFQGGQLEADVRAAEAKARQLLYDYGNTLLSAIEEVENSLSAERHERKLVANIESRLDLARKTSLFLKEKYLAGDVEYLRFLASQLSVDELETQLVRERFKLLQNRVRLYKALGGPIPPERRH